MKNQKPTREPFPDEHFIVTVYPDGSKTRIRKANAPKMTAEEEAILYRAAEPTRITRRTAPPTPGNKVDE